jgi:membrane protein
MIRPELNTKNEMDQSMLKQFFIELYQIWITERPSQQAAALAFASMFSFAPIIFIALSVVGIFSDKIQVGNQFYQRLQNILGEEIAVLIGDSIAALVHTSYAGSLLVSIISFLALLFTASGVFFQVHYVLNTIWHVPPPQKSQTVSFLRQRLFSLAIVFGVGLLGIIAVLTNLVLAWFGSILERLVHIDANQSFGFGVSALVLVMITCALFYKLLPETKVAWRDVWLGAGVAALLVVAAVTLTGLFFRNSSLSSALQAAGGFSVLLLGFYYVAQIFLLGAVICRVYANLFGSRCSNLERI